MILIICEAATPEQIEEMLRTWDVYAYIEIYFLQVVDFLKSYYQTQILPW